MGGGIRRPGVRRGEPLRQNAAAVPAHGGTVRPGAGLRGGQRQRAPSRAGIGGAAQGGGAGPCQRGDQLQPGAHQRGPGQKVPHHLRDGHHRGQVVRAAVPALPPLLLPGEPGAGGAAVRLDGGIRPAHRGGAAVGFILRRGDHWALPGGEGPAAAGGGNHPGGGGECPGKRQTQRH